MTRTQDPDAAADSVPTANTPASAINGARRALALGVLALCTRPLLAKIPSANEEKYDAACSSAKAVHDQRCPNYTGFKTPAEKEALARQAEKARPMARRQPSGRRSKIRVGRTVDRGVASWYGPGFQGRKTASGEIFDMNELTAAHKTLPFGTHVQVESHSTGKKVMVRINDRGPFVGNRIIDLSRAAAQELGIVHSGYDTVVLREAEILAA